MNTIANCLTKVEEQINTSQANLAQQQVPNLPHQAPNLSQQPQNLTQQPPNLSQQPHQVLPQSQQLQSNHGGLTNVTGMPNHNALRQQLHAQSAQQPQKQFIPQNPHLHQQQQFQLHAQQLLLQQQQGQQQLQQQHQQQPQQQQQPPHQTAPPVIPPGQGTTSQLTHSQQSHQPSNAPSANQIPMDQNQSSASHPPQSQGLSPAQMQQHQMQMAKQGELSRKGPGAGKRASGAAESKVSYELRCCW